MTMSIEMMNNRIDKLTTTRLLPWRMAVIHCLLGISVLCTAHAQEPDSTWDDLGLDPEGFEFESDLIGHYSHGWFPQPYSASSLSIGLNVFWSDVFDRATNIRPSGFHPTTDAFSWHDPFIGNEQEIMQAGKNEEEDDDYPETGYSEYLLSYLYNLPMPAILRGDLWLRNSDGLLFSNDTTRSYLSLSGQKHALKEVGVAHLSEYVLGGSFGLNIPVYGVFLESEVGTIASYYYIHAGVSAGYVLVSKATQYAQIANAKDELRYGNGRDTVNYLLNVKLADLNRFRTGLDFAAGWNVAAFFGVFTFEAFFSVPMNSVLKDVEWQQYVAGFRIGLGYQWEPEGESK
jgi:hypothetical protein